MKTPERIRRQDFEIPKIRIWLLKQKDISPLALRVMLFWMEERGDYNPLHTSYGKLLRRDRRQIQKAFKELREKKILEDVTEAFPDSNKRCRTYQYHIEMLKRVFPHLPRFKEKTDD